MGVRKGYRLEWLNKDQVQLTHLSDFLDLGATFADERAALAGGHNQLQCHWRVANHGTGRAERTV